MIVSIKGNWGEAIEQHDSYVRSRLIHYLGVFAAAPNISSCTVEFLQALPVAIGVLDYPALRETISTYQRYFEKCHDNEDQERFLADVQMVFDYERFSSKSTAGWNAYSLCKLSRTRTCPYCNQAYAFTVVNESSGRGLRPTLDHFLPKHRFPHLALSLNNLVPSCYVCNSNLKGKTDFYEAHRRHLHPLYDAEAIEFRLQAEGVDGIELISNFEALKSKVSLQIDFDESRPEVRNSAETFLIAERYETHLEDAVEFASLRVLYDRHRIEELRLLGIEMSEAKLLRFDRSRYRNVLLGKMYADLFDAFQR